MKDKNSVNPILFLFLAMNITRAMATRQINISLNFVPIEVNISGNGSTVSMDTGINSKNLLTFLLSGIRMNIGNILKNIVITVIIPIKMYNLFPIIFPL